MKSWGTAVLIVAVVWCLPMPIASAASSPALAELLTQLHQLQEQLRSLQAATPLPSTTPEAAAVIKEYYSGDFTDAYQIRDGHLVSTSPVSTTDALLFDLVTAVFLTGREETRLTEFRTYNDPDNQYDAFIVLLPQRDHWLLAINTAYFDVFDQDDRVRIDELLIHEYSHLLQYYDQDFVDAFADQFWGRADYRQAAQVQEAGTATEIERLRTRYFDRNPDSFVSPYATTNLEEDIAESFLWYVSGPLPRDTSIASQKIRFFATDPIYVQLRALLQSEREIVQ